MWQSRVEIEHYSDTYFDRIIVFEALQRRTSTKSGANMHFVNVSSIHEFNSLPTNDAVRRHEINVPV